MKRYFESLRRATAPPSIPFPMACFCSASSACSTAPAIRRSLITKSASPCSNQHTWPALVSQDASTPLRAPLWKLAWFLREFGYDPELLGKDEIDDKALIGLQGVVKVRHVIVHGLSMLNLEGFASAARWEELSSANITDRTPGSEVA